MLSKIKSMLKEPAFWVLAVVIALVVTAYSSLRNPLKAVASRFPKADVQ